jgi:hypothetical protein
MRPAKAAERYLVGWDTEDDSNGKPLLFVFVHERGSYVTERAEDGRMCLVALAHEQQAHGRVVEAWATNLEYDLVNLFGEFLPELVFQFGRTQLCGARWRRIEFRDTLRHVPASVEELGSLHGLPKLARPLRRRGETLKAFNKRQLPYALRDGTITYRTARLIRDSYAEFGELPKLTLPATAYRIWARAFWKRPVHRVPDEVREAATVAYFGGRTEAFALGTFENVRVIDAASMFPWAMTAAPFPIPWGPFRRVRSGDPPQPGGLYRARVESRQAIPVLPYRAPEGNIFPVGAWSSWFVGEELQAHLASGGKARVLGGFEWLEHARPFDAYIAEMFARKNGSRGPMQRVWKLLLNSLYGKFGQKGGRVRCTSLEKFAKLKKQPIEFRVWKGMVLWQQDAPPPPWGNMIWSALITARARVRLYQEFGRLRKLGARVLYCDTDSVIYSGVEGRYPVKASRPGDFEARGRFRRALIVGKKEYGLEDDKGHWEVHVKGVPLAERLKYLETGEANFQRPTRLREAARLGLDANLWRDVQKTRRTDMRKNRRRRPDGALAPVEIHG